MKIRYDHQADALYLSLTSVQETVAKSREVEPGVVLDLNNEGRVIGVEMLDVSHRFRPSEIFEFSVEHVGERVLEPM